MAFLPARRGNASLPRVRRPRLTPQLPTSRGSPCAELRSGIALSARPAAAPPRGSHAQSSPDAAAPRWRARIARRTHTGSRDSAPRGFSSRCTPVRPVRASFRMRPRGRAPAGPRRSWASLRQDCGRPRPRAPSRASAPAATRDGGPHAAQTRFSCSSPCGAHTRRQQDSS